MDPAKIDAWQRFREQVLYDSGWSRRLWFAAVEDGLRRALGDEARVVAEFRQDAAELLQLEGAASRSEQDERRLVQLEAQIGRLIEQTDAAMTAAAPGAPAAVATPAPEARAPVRSRGRAFALGALLFVLGAAAAGLYHEMRLTTQADRQAALLSRLLDERVATLEAELDERLTATGPSAGDAAGALRERVAAMSQVLDELGLELGAVGARLPALDGQVEAIAAGAQQVAGELAGVSAEIGALKSAPPELTASLARQRDELERGLQGRRDGLSAITARVQALEDEVAQSQQLLTTFNRALDQGLQQAKSDGDALKGAVEEMRANGLEAAALLDGVKAKAASAHQEMQARIDGMLSQLAEQADLAVLRGQDVIGRAESEVARRIDAESEATLAALAEAREAQLAVLAEQVAATQAELEQTRAGLIDSWQRMDQTVAERQQQALAGLEAYAQTIETRVEELLQALDVMVARTGG